MSRLDALRKFIVAQPSDPFPRYGLAMELKNTGQKDEAHAAFIELATKFPDYVPQYLMHANLLVEMGRRDDAKAVLEHGIKMAGQKGDNHALGEMQGLLASL